MLSIIILIDIITLSIIVMISSKNGLERALPCAAFVLVLIPRESGIQIPGFFDLSTQRLVLAVLSILFAFWPRRIETGRKLRTPLLGLMCVHFFWCVVSTTNSIVPAMSIKKGLSEVLEYYLLYYIFFKTIRSVTTIRQILYAIASATVIGSFFGAVEAYTGWRVLSLFPIGASHFSATADDLAIGRGLRVQATFPHPILWGAALVTAITISIYLLTVIGERRKRAFLWLGLLMMFLNLYRTESRGPWLGLVLTFALYYFFGQRSVRRSLTAIAALALLVMIIRPGIRDSIMNIYYGSLNPNNPLSSSYQYRYGLRDVAVTALSASPARALWGYGMESFFYLHLIGTLDGEPHAYLSCDSAWIEVAVETGYVGLAILAALLLSPAWTAWKDFRRFLEPDRYLSLCLLLCLIAYFFMMLSVALYAWGQNSYMLWLLIACTMTFSRLNDPELASGKARTY